MTAERNARALQRTQPFLERFLELESIGVRDVDMPRRLGVSAGSLVRMMQREGLNPSTLLKEIAGEEKRA